MTAQTRVVNKARFEQGDKPQGTDYADLIDSFVALTDTTAQAMASDLSVQALTAVSINTPLASVSVMAVGVLTADTISVSTVESTFVSGATVNAGILTVAGTATFTVGVDLNSILINAAVTALSSAESSAIFTGGVHITRFLKLVVQGSTFSVPLFNRKFTF